MSRRSSITHRSSISNSAKTAHRLQSLRESLASASRSLHPSQAGSLVSHIRRNSLPGTLSGNASTTPRSRRMSASSGGSRRASQSLASFAKRRSLSQDPNFEDTSSSSSEENVGDVIKETESHDNIPALSGEDMGSEGDHHRAAKVAKEKETPKPMKQSKLQNTSCPLRRPAPTELIFEPSKFPASYKTNSIPEQKCLKVCGETLRQFRDLHFDRRPLFLKPLNEFNVEKLVCTTIKPTQLRWDDLLDWPDISRFVADYLDYDKLQPPHKLPTKMFAPQTVLRRRRGHSFEYSTVLTSMLIGSGYDAYVVSGYATREVSRCDLSYTPCPYVEADEKKFTKTMTVDVCRYTVKPPKTLESRFEMRMKMKAAREKKEHAELKRRLHDHCRALREAPPADKISGWRVHAWVLVLPGQRDVTKPFFIEATSGTSHTIEWDQYLGIESLWNHKNYYINVHREAVDPTVHVCKRTTPAPFLFPINKMTFDIGNSCSWDYIFQWQDLHRSKTEEEAKQEEDLGGASLEEMFVEVPHSWSEKLSVTLDDYLRRYPTGLKTIRYKKAKVDFMADYIQPCGIVQKLWVYSDLKCKSLLYSKETFAHRADFLMTRYFEQATGKVIEHFAEGRADFVKEHHYYFQTPDINTKRTIVYYSNKRSDELYRREEGPDFIRLHYGENTQDRMYKKETRYGPDGFTRERPDHVHPYSRHIESIEECYRRDPSVPADEDIHRIVFTVKDDTIDIEYHVADHRIVGSTRHFTKPDNWWIASQVLAWDPQEHHRQFEADQCSRSSKEFKIYEMLLACMERERLSAERSRMLERDTHKLLLGREKEECHYKLCRPYFIPHLNPNIREVRLAEKAKAKAAEIFKKSDKKHDYLEPTIWRLDLEEVTNKKQAVKVKEECMQDLKNRLFTQTNLLREEYEQMKKTIVVKQRDYHENFIKMSREEEEQCRSDIMQEMFVAHILEHRIAQHKEFAPVKYQYLVDTLCRDPRLEPYLV